MTIAFLPLGEGARLQDIQFDLVTMYVPQAQSLTPQPNFKQFVRKTSHKQYMSLGLVTSCS